ncbi:transposase family protein, partial [Streptomyces globisporus]|uniref:transposase family protein n=1 Tax=Streptomyces globisporus TaxID=1908 RepID=UPI00345FFF41
AEAPLQHHADRRRRPGRRRPRTHHLIKMEKAQGSRPTFRTPYYHHREQPAHYQEFNRNHARLRAPRERAFAQLKSWRLLRRARCSTRRIGTIVQAVHTLLTCDYRG